MTTQRYNFFNLRAEPVVIFLYYLPRKTKVVLRSLSVMCKGDLNYFWTLHLFEL